MATVTELLAQLRLDLEDPEYPGSGQTPDSDSLWSNAELIHYIDQAQKQLCLEVDVLPDATSFTSTVTAGDKWILRDPLIARIREGYMTTYGRVIKPTTQVEIARGYVTDDYGLTAQRSDWRSTTGVPDFVITDMDAAQLRLVPESTVDDTIEWSVYRLPLEDVVSTGSELEIDPLFHYKILWYAKALAFNKQDAETQDMTRAREAKSQWNNKVVPEAHKYFRRKYRTPGTTGYGGIV